MPDTPAPPPAAVDDLVVSFNQVRRALGLLGFLLPVLLGLVAMLTPEVWYPSISEFYHGRAGDLFVGIMCALGVFLWSYVGHRDTTQFPSDRLVARVAGAGALLVALIPTDDDTGLQEAGCSLLACWAADAEGGLWQKVHYASAAVFLAALAVMCWFNFRRMKPRYDNPAELAVKLRKNRLFARAACIIVAAMAGLGVFGVTYHFAGEGFATTMDASHTVFVLETVAVWAFAWAWLIKGEVPFLLKWHKIEDPAP